jgi:hypothetical protein
MLLPHNRCRGFSRSYHPTFSPKKQMAITSLVVSPPRPVSLKLLHHCYDYEPDALECSNLVPFTKKLPWARNLSAPNFDPHKSTLSEGKMADIPPNQGPTEAGRRNSDIHAF